MKDNEIEDTRQAPEYPETEYCDECQDELEILDDFDGLKYTKCVNEFCPQNFTGVAKEMAELIVEQKDTIERLTLKLRRAKTHLTLQEIESL